ncbi:hypothetical protein KJI95_10020 [Shewanella sp. JM162201]|uniref:DUF6436 domain-containing protein n=1 Tax=Shewanella jiangmenensis TaxID=2837387 RepID=A0ABS5V340_9GAMM|nr:DUF6436 domain-containing protein [Shewanella jiangmenensis]MBT1444858.1 hypothetical protein [Shewanella jiangmenensis]
MTKKRLSMLILSGWLVSVLLVFWWFELRYISRIEPSLLNQDRVGAEMGELIKAAGTSADGAPVVVHFIDPECGCSRETYEHLKTLAKSSAGKAQANSSGAKARVLVSNHTDLLFTRTDGALPEPLNEMKRINLNHVPAVTPAVGVWKADGTLVYLGAYSTGPSCGSGADLLQEALRSAAGDPAPLPDWPIQVSCHCRWTS